VSFNTNSGKERRFLENVPSREPVRELIEPQ
jgi:hypothetical protein